MNASFMKMTRALTVVHKRCCLGLGIARSHFLNFHRRNLHDLIGRHVSPWRIWLVDWVSSIGRPDSWPIFVRFRSGKMQCLSQAVYFNISTGNFWPNYPFNLVFKKIIVTKKNSEKIFIIGNLSQFPQISSILRFMMPNTIAICNSTYKSQNLHFSLA